MSHNKRPFQSHESEAVDLRIIPSASLMETGANVVYDQVPHFGRNSTSGAAADVTMVVTLHIRTDCWQHFKEAYLEFISHFEKLSGHSKVTFSCTDGTPLDRYLPTLPNSEGQTQSFHAQHEFKSLAHMQAALGSKLRNAWDLRLAVWSAKDPEFYSFDGLRGFFSLNRSYAPSLPPPQPPPKWRIGLIIFIAGVTWSWILDFCTAVIKMQMTIFPPQGPPNDSQRITWDLAITAINLLPVFFLWGPLLMELPFIKAFFAMPWTMPGPDITQEQHATVGVLLFWRPLRWLLF